MLVKKIHKNIAHFTFNRNFQNFLFVVGLMYFAIFLRAQEGPLPKEIIPDLELNNLIQGHLYNPSYQHIKGEHLLYKFWKLGDVLHIENEYKDIPLWYDVYIDDVILLDWQNEGFGYVRLVKSYIHSFSLANRNFINIVLSKYAGAGLEPGYYEVLTEGEVTLLARRKVVRKEDNYIPYFERDDQLFIIRNGKASLIKNKKSLYDILGEDEKKQVGHFIKSNSIKIKKADDRDWMDIINLVNNMGRIMN